MTDTGPPVYYVLARNYRPETSADLVGQEAMVRTLKNAFKADRIAQAFIMTGIRGTGKTTTARIIAKGMNCIGQDGKGGPTTEPCGTCEHCVAIMEGRHVDVMEMDAASNTGVDNIRDTIIDTVHYRAASARYKIYIIDEVHMLSPSAFNALLKTLEEPPAHVKFIFATTEIRKVPVTVLSRCQRFDLRRIEPEVQIALLRKLANAENAAITDDALALIARAAEGSARDATSLLDQAISHGAGETTAGQVRDMLGLADKGAQRELLGALLAGEGKAMLAVVERQYALGVEPLALVRGLMELVHAVTVLQVGGGEAQAASAEERAALEGWAGAIGAGQLHRLWQLLLKGHDEVRSAPDPLVGLQMALLRAMHAADMPDPGTLAKVLEDMAARAPSAGSGDTASDGSRAPEAPPWEALVERVAQVAGEHAANVMRLQVRVVELGADRLVYAQPPEFREDKSAELRDALKQATGERWTVERVESGGALTIVEAELAKAEAARQELRADPLVAAALASFPEAEFIETGSDRRVVGGSD